MSSILILLVNQFPFGPSEPYLEAELPAYESFSGVEIFSLSTRKGDDRNERSVPENVRVHRVPLKPAWVYGFGAMRAVVSQEFREEVGVLVRQRRLSARRMFELLVFMGRAHVEASAIARRLRRYYPEPASDVFTFYSYRFMYQPYAAYRAARYVGRAVHVSRAHGMDLYEERSESQYLPMRRFNLRVLDRVYPVSKDGAEYLSRKIPEYADKIQVSYLGTRDSGTGPSPLANSGRLRVLSCSNMFAIKRIDRIVDSLRRAEVAVEWVHIGEGPLREELEQYANDRLRGSLCSWAFVGSLSNAEVHRHLARESYDMFVNLSDGEGVPVSIMEALSFGVPVIATDVGGTSEVVTDGVNGFLVNPDEAVETVPTLLNWFASASHEEAQRLRSNARDSWATKFDSEANYASFASALQVLMKRHN